MWKPSLALLAALALLATACGKAAAPPGPAAVPGASLRLDRSAEPVSYRIDVTPDIKALTFRAHADIVVDVKTPVRILTLNALELNLARVRLDGGDPGKVVLNGAAQTASFDFGSPVTPGRHVLAIDYAGRINTFSAGLFVLDYTTPQGPRRMMVSQFENTDARGYRYEPRHPLTGRPWPPMPDALLELWDRLALAPGPPDACLVNVYDADARMGLHQDKDEADFAIPVLSVSLGDTAIFRLGGPRRSDPTRTLRLASGDVCLLSGAARLWFHGVDRIIPGSSRLIQGGGRINLTLRRAQPLGL